MVDCIVTIPVQFRLSVGVICECDIYFENEVPSLLATSATTAVLARVHTKRTVSDKKQTIICKRAVK